LIAIVGFAFGGAALSMAFYTGFFVLLALAPALVEVVAAERENARAPDVAVTADRSRSPTVRRTTSRRR
jgi:hypothetical protein